MLDKLSNLGDSKSHYQRLYDEFENLNENLSDLQAHVQTRERELDLLTHQIKELEQVQLSRKKYDEFMVEQTRIGNLGTAVLAT